MVLRREKNANISFVGCLNFPIIENNPELPQPHLQGIRTNVRGSGQAYVSVLAIRNFIRSLGS